MDANYYDADTENGDHVADPSEEALVMLIKGLNLADNTFVVLTAADGDWYASVSLLDDGGYEIERSDPHHNIHDLATSDDVAGIAHDLTSWLTARDYPTGQPNS